MEYHQYANLFPMMNASELHTLCNDMTEHGYDVTAPIVLYNGLILDGRNRQVAADTIGIVPVYIAFEGTDQDALNYVIRHNLHRRHLSESQRAVIAGRLETMQHGGNRQDANLHLEISRADAATMLNVSPRTVASAKQVEREAPELIAKIENGEMSIHEAAVAIKKSKREEEITIQREEIKTNKFQSPTGKYEVIVIDPPWMYGTKYDPDGRRAASPYPEMTLEEIKAIELPASDDCVLWLWTTHKFMREAYPILDAWGFRDVAILTWVKSRMGLGSWLRSQSEFCIMAVKGSPAVNLTNQTTVIHGEMREHSRKPEEFYMMVESLCNGYKLDYFSRQSREGWVVFGNDTGRFDELGR